MAEICSQIIQDFCEITSYERCKLQYWGREARVKQHIETSSKITTYVWRTYAKSLPQWPLVAAAAKATRREVEPSKNTQRACVLHRGKGASWRPVQSLCLHDHSRGAKKGCSLLSMVLGVVTHSAQGVSCPGAPKEKDEARALRIKCIFLTFTILVYACFRCFPEGEPKRFHLERARDATKSKKEFAGFIQRERESHVES